MNIIGCSGGTSVTGNYGDFRNAKLDSMTVIHRANNTLQPFTVRTP
jgi:hypothetical protein